MNKNLISGLLVVTYGIALFFLCSNINWFINLLFNIVSIMTPFIYGLIIAYIVNWPYTFFRRNLSNVDIKSNSFIDKNKMVNSLSLILAYCCVLGVAAFLIIIIVPQIIISFRQLVDNLSSYIESFRLFVIEVQKKLNINLVCVENDQKMMDDLTSYADSFKSRMLPKLINFTKMFAVKTYNWILGIVVSMYLLGSKDRLINQLSKIVKVTIPSKISNKIKEILNLTHNTFWKFIIGKFIDSAIIGLLCFIGMSIFNIPYAILISVVVGITNIIPFFGPFIGAIPSIFILFIIDPVKALYFALFIFLLQQVDGNIIGPKILGSSVGVSGLWIMFSVMLGGGLFGVLGMVAGVPIFAVIYTLCGQVINKKLKKMEGKETDGK